MRSISTSGKATSIPPDPMPDTAALPALPRDEGGPVFAEPWQAHAFALAVKLSEAGVFSWSEWAAALGAELAAASGRGEPDDGSRYYHHWLAALERLVAAKDIVAGPTLLARKEEWAEAYRCTPHGRPVALQHTEAAPHPSSSPRPLPNLPPLGEEGKVGARGEKEGPAPGLQRARTAPLSAPMVVADGSSGAREGEGQ